jgi:hypothetical protein
MGDTPDHAQAQMRLPYLVAAAFGGRMNELDKAKSGPTG